MYNSYYNNNIYIYILARYLKIHEDVCSTFMALILDGGKLRAFARPEISSRPTVLENQWQIFCQKSAISYNNRCRWAFRLCEACSFIPVAVGISLSKTATSLDKWCSFNWQWGGCVQGLVMLIVLILVHFTEWFWGYSLKGEERHDHEQAPVPWLILVGPGPAIRRSRLQFVSLEPKTANTTNKKAHATAGCSIAPPEEPDHRIPTTSSES